LYASEAGGAIPKRWSRCVETAQSEWQVPIPANGRCGSIWCVRAFCGFNPLKGYALGELERCAGDPNLHHGIKLHFDNSDAIRQQGP